jgi:diguanylate cyclase (GGDEF)-like protein
LLKKRVEARKAINVEQYRTLAETLDALARRRPLLAVTDLHLSDAPDGEILALLADHDIPTILVTDTIDREIRERFSALNIVDYFVKGARDTVEQITSTILRFTEEKAPGILIVDDMQSSRASLVALLNRQNYRIYEASSGREALNILSDNHDIELVIVDYQMPDMDGHELTQCIRAHYAADRIRTIGISASSDPFLSASFLKAGASDFIYRPFIAEEVKCRIESNIDTLNHIRNLRFLAERDSLTGLYNRRAFFERAYVRLEDMKSSGQSGSVAILDIDHFKKVNDSYGHDIGDAVIRQVARVLNDQGDRSDSVVARFGGEEFVILFAGVSSTEVQARCEAIRQTIAELAIPCDSGVLSVTVSIGAALIQLSEGMDNNLNAADQMLYMAKNTGRNRVIYDAIFYNA